MFKCLMCITICLIASQTIAANAPSNAPPVDVRVLHFPKDRSLGRIKVLDANIKRHIQISKYDSLDSVSYHDWYDWKEKADDLGEARGDVVIPAGKKVGLFLHTSTFHDLSPLLNLRADDLYMLSHGPYAWNENYSLPDKCMQQISHLSGLKDLRLYGVTVSTNGMKHITKLQSLEMFALPKGLTNRGLVYVTELKSLKRLHFNDNRINNKGLEYSLGKMANLEELTLYGEQINDDGLVCLANLTKLSFLSLRSGNFTDAGLAHVKKCPSLRILDLMHLPITGAGLQHLSGHPRLENLRLFNTEVTDRGLVYLKSIHSLKKLNVGKRNQKDQVTDAGMIHLAQINSLEHLELPHRDITDKGLIHIAKLKNLKFLWVGCGSSSQLNNVALKHISKLQSLESLQIGGAGISDDGMKELAKLTNLKQLHFPYADSITNDGLSHLKELKNLERLDLGHCKNITISGLSHLNTLKNLSRLQIDFGLIQDGSGLDISGLTKLEELWLRVDAPIYDKDLACMENLKNLRRLTMGGVKHSKKPMVKSMITDAGISHLQNLDNLKKLSCGSPYLTDKALACFANMKQIQSLTVYGNFTDDGLTALKGAKTLRFLKIYSSNKFTPAAIEDLRKSLPYLRSLTAEQRTNPR